MAKLQLVHSSQTVKRERNIAGIVHRASQHAEDRNRNLTRRYSSVENAFMRMSTFMLMYGFVGDVCEIVHNTSGLQLGTLKVTAKGTVRMWLNLKGE